LIAQATDDGIRVHILFIPSKQAVFYNYARAQGFSTMCEQMRGVFEAEEALVFDFASFFNSRRVKTCYLRDLLSQKALLGIKIYPSSSDDHPTVDGYQVYAESAYRLLTNRDGGL